MKVFELISLWSCERTKKNQKGKKKPLKFALGPFFSFACEQIHGRKRQW